MDRYIEWRVTGGGGGEVDKVRWAGAGLYTQHAKDLVRGIAHVGDKTAGMSERFQQLSN